MWKKLVSLLLLSAALALPGCCGFARAFCPVSQTKAPGRLTRDSAEEALDFIVDAFRRRAVADIYQSLHPEFRAQYGGFSQAEFTSAFDEYEHLFREDAEEFANAKRTVTEKSTNGLFQGIRLDSTDGSMTALLVFKRETTTFIKLDDEFVPESQGTTSSTGEAMQIEDGWVFLKEPVFFEGLTGVRPEQVRRFEIHDDWLLHDIRNDRGIKFKERLAETQR
jgi:hypothetical protein